MRSVPFSLRCPQDVRARGGPKRSANPAPSDRRQDLGDDVETVEGRCGDDLLVLRWRLSRYDSLLKAHSSILSQGRDAKTQVERIAQASKGQSEAGRSLCLVIRYRNPHTRHLRLSRCLRSGRTERAASRAAKQPPIGGDIGRSSACAQPQRDHSSALCRAHEQTKSCSSRPRPAANEDFQGVKWTKEIATSLRRSHR